MEYCIPQIICLFFRLTLFLEKEQEMVKWNIWCTGKALIKVKTLGSQ